MLKKILEVLGWYGVAAIIIAYALSSFSVIKPSSLIYQTLNLTGALGIVGISLYKKAYQPGVLNTIWAIVALLAIIKIFIIR